jgi:hypothetical protein
LVYQENKLQLTFGDNFKTIIKEKRSFFLFCFILKGRKKVNRVESYLPRDCGRKITEQRIPAAQQPGSQRNALISDLPIAVKEDAVEEQPWELGLGD